MITRPLSRARFEQFQAHTPDKSQTDLMGFYDADRVFTYWMYKELAKGVVKFSRHAYDYRGPDSFVGDEFDLATVSYAEDAGCWRWKARTQLGHRSGYLEAERSRDVFPVQALSMADAHVLGGMAHDRFCVGSLTSEVVDTPFSLPLVDRSTVVLPWTRRHPKDRARRSGGYVEYHRLLISRPGCFAPVMHPFYSRRRLGARRAVALISKMGSQQAATIRGRMSDGRMLYTWSVKTPSIQLVSGESDALVRCIGACEAVFDALDLWVPPTVEHLESRVAAMGLGGICE